jgi:acetyl esterase
MHNLDANTPPTIIFHGTEDKIIPVAVAELYQKKMDENKIRCDLFLYANEPHGFFNNSKYAETLSEADRFLVSLGYLGTKPKQ